MKIGVDLGGSNIYVGLVDGGKILKSYKLKTEPLMGEERVIFNLITAVKNVFNDKVEMVCVGCPGPLDFEKGMTLNTPNVPQNMNIVEPLKKEFGVEVVLENDANCFGAGEFNFGRGKGKKNVVCITLGTGFGTAVFINGELYKGKGNAVEFGHTTIKFDNAKGRDGIRGSVEYYLSTSAQKRYADELGLGHIKSAIKIQEMAVDGEKRASEVFEKFGFYLGIAVANLINTFDPEIVIIGGACAGSWDYFSERMFEQIKKRSIVEPCEVVKSELENAGVLGATVLGENI